uniref:Uncharacterized protein n=1 Tax=Zea mays TaxID=4577 RepID=C4IY51_MAIZE|nr:unknown [Zea mays]ACR37093.1 unknown [Zea mays]ACR37551.1 unknown [Zea mays]
MTTTTTIMPQHPQNHRACPCPFAHRRPAAHLPHYPAHQLHQSRFVVVLVFEGQMLGLQAVEVEYVVAESVASELALV